MECRIERNDMSDFPLNEGKELNCNWCLIDQLLRKERMSRFK